MDMNREEGSRKKILFVFLIGAGLLGTVVFWLVSPMLFKGGTGEDNPSSAFYDELSNAEQASKTEESYLDEANRPVEITEDAMDDSSLALIKGVGGKKEEPKADTSEKKYEPPRKISTLDNIRKSAGEKLAKISGFGFGSGGGGRGGSGGRGDYSDITKRFAKDSGFKGGNVKTGPGSGTSFKGSGKRDASFDPKQEQAAASAQKRFEGESAKAVDPKAAAAQLGGSVPKELQDKPDGDDKRAPEAPKNEKRDKKDPPCEGIESNEATAKLVLGAVFMALGMFAGGSGTTSEWTQRETRVVGGANQEVNVEYKSGGGSNTGDANKQGMNMLQEGALDLADPRRNCKKRGSSSSGGSTSSSEKGDK